MADVVNLRRAPLVGATGPQNAAVALQALPPMARAILRLRDPASVRPGLALPVEPCRSVVAGEQAILWLGPDEWLLLEPDHAALAAALSGVRHSLVDVSHRQSAFTIKGLQAEATLNAGCPLDLDASAFPVGMCTRTVLAKCQIVLWRTAPDTFHVEAWRSFLPYAWAFLTEAAREFSG
jgi:sarcosine oxidase subunit gamma